MSVRRLSNSFISTEGRGKSSTLLAGYSPAIDEMDLIERITVGSGGASSIEFTNIPSTYQHLQVRLMTRRSITGNGAAVYARVGNSTIDTGSNYAWHLFYGSGDSTASTGGSSQTSMYLAFATSTSQLENVFGAGIIDILDYSSSTKNKTIRSYSGYDSNGSGYNGFASGLWVNTSVIDRLLFFPTSSNWVQNSTAALYGVKA